MATKSAPKKWKKVTNSREDIIGFWSRVGDIQGDYVKSFEYDGKFGKQQMHLFRATENIDTGVIKDEDEVKVTIGQVFAVNGSTNINLVLAEVKGGTSVRFESHGKKEGGRYGEFWDIDVYVAE